MQQTSSPSKAISDIPVAYQTSHPPAGSGAFLYLIKGGLTPQYVLNERSYADDASQGQIPEDAFDGEELLEGLDEDEDEEDRPRADDDQVEPNAATATQLEPQKAGADAQAQ